MGWGDEDEVQYREWIKEQIEGRDPAEWNEYQSEQEYRDRLREETEKRSGEKINWEDTKENELRLKYLELRKERRDNMGPVEWDDDGERAARERARQLTEERAKKEVVWDLDKWGHPI